MKHPLVLSFLTLNLMVTLTLAQLGFARSAGPQTTGAAGTEGQTPKRPSLKMYDVQGPKETPVESPEEAADFLKITQTKEADQQIPLIEDFLKKYPESGNWNNVQLGLVYDYRAVNNIPKMIENGEIALKKFPNDIDLLAAMAAAYNANNMLDKSIEIGTQTLGLLEKLTPPAGVDTAAWTAQRNRYMAICQLSTGSAYLAKYEDERKAQKDAAASGSTSANPAATTSTPAVPAAGTASTTSATSPYMVKAQQYLENAVALVPQNDFGLFQLGILYAYQGQVGKAMSSLIKAVALGGQIAPGARQNLEYLYKLSHKGSLDGLEPLIENAKAALVPPAQAPAATPAVVPNPVPVEAPAPTPQK